MGSLVCPLIIDLNSFLFHVSNITKKAKIIHNSTKYRWADALSPWITCTGSLIMVEVVCVYSQAPHMISCELDAF